jgi:hypothetical protein
VVWAEAVLPAKVMLLAEAMSMVSAILMAIEMVGEFQREKALLLVASAVLAVNEIEREGHRRKGKVAVPPPHPHLSIVPPQISTQPPS